MSKRFTEGAYPVIFLAALLAGGCSSQPAQKMPSATSVTAAAEIEEEFQGAVEQMQQGQWQEAVIRLEDITRKDDRLAGPWLNLGIAYAQLGEPDQAETALLAAIQRNAANPVAYNQLGILYRKTGAPREARRVYQAALEVAPDDPDTHWNLGILFDVYLQDAGQALHHYRRYRHLTGSQDPQLLLWIAGVEQRSQAGQMTAVAGGRQ